MAVHKKPIEEQIRQVLSALLHRRVRDPALDEITITRVKVSPDLQFADVRYTFLEDDTRSAEEVDAGFARAKGALKRMLASRINLRRIPDLRFHLDRDVYQERRIEELLNQIKSS